MGSQMIDILLVEDSWDDSAFFSHALAESMPEAHLCVVHDGVEALEMLFAAEDKPEPTPASRPRVIILDLMLPKISGIDILRKLKTNPQTRAIPVVILSSSREKRDLAEAYQAGANSYLFKPMDFDEFASLVQALGHYWLQLNNAPPP